MQNGKVHGITLFWNYGIHEIICIEGKLTDGMFWF